MKIKGYKSETQGKNIAWFLPRPKKDHYKGGMPLYAEEWFIQLAKDILQEKEYRILQLFCGMNTIGFRVDIKPEVKPDLIADAHDFSKHIISKFNIIFADPPYSKEESKDLYGTPPVNYKKWTKECDKVLVKGGLLIVYHKYVMPNPDPEKYQLVKRVFVGNRTYHLPRIALIFRKK